MEILTWLFAGITGFLGNVLANDFCEAAPTLSKKIIEVAVRRLPNAVRNRYAEEWRADLLDQPGAIAKLKWSVGCLICARRMSRKAVADYLSRLMIQIVAENGAVTANPATLMMSRAFSHWMYGQSFSRFAPGRWLPSILSALVLVPIYLYYQRRYCGRPDLELGARMLRLKGCWKVTRIVDGIPSGVVEEFGRDQTQLDIR